MSLSGILLDVFEISGRDGCVALLKADAGKAKVGDQLTIGDRTRPITGVEMICYRNPPKDAAEEELRDAMGVQLGGSKKSDLLPLVGHRFTTSTSVDSAG